MERVLRKIPIESKLDVFYVVSIEWQEESVSVTVIDNDVTWTGKFQTDSEEILQFSTAVDKTKEAYLIELKHALLDNESDYTFLIEKDDFIVKKILFNSNIKIKFCIIHLQKVPPFPTYMALLSSVLDQEKSNSRNISKLVQEVQYLKAEREDFIRQLQQFASEKASLETILYSKFCKILNAKKEKIIYLESQLGASGDSKINQHIDISSSDKSKNEQNLQENIAANKRTAQDHPATKRKCTALKDLEDPQNSKTREAQCTLSRHNSSALETGNKNLNPYDSNTEVDTDDESVPSDSAVADNTKVLPSSICELDTPPRILPKRGGGCSTSVLPKRVNTNVSTSNSIKYKEKLNTNPSSSTSNKEFDDKFDSQSLLDDY